MSLAAFLALVLALYGVAIPAVDAPVDWIGFVPGHALRYKVTPPAIVCGEAELGERVVIRIRELEGLCTPARLRWVVLHELGHARCWVAWRDASEACAERERLRIEEEAGDAVPDQP